MKTLILLLFVSTALAQNGQPNVTDARFETRAFSGDLHSQIRGVGPVWFGYSVKAISGDHRNCCWNQSGQSGCRLEEGGAAVSNKPSKRPVQLEESDALAVLFRVWNNRVGEVKVYSLSCPLSADGLPFIWVTGVPAHASLSYLHDLATTGSSSRVTDSAIFAIAQHEGDEADAVLEQLVTPGEPEHIRDNVTFWLGASRGARGVAVLKKILANDGSEHVRDKGVFALSISKQPEALDALIQAAKTDASTHVRGQAIFWLAQKAGKRAASTITDAIANDPDGQVKKRAVFALSQLPKDEGVPRLIEVARTQRNPEVRKQAFFWLGQSHDSRALAFIEQALTK